MGWRAHAPWCLALLLLLLPGHGHLLVGDEGAIGRDYGMLFLDVLVQQRAALLDGHLLLWDASQISGTTFWGLPNQAPLYPPLMACLALLSAIRGLNLGLFLHVAWGALGTYALVHLLTRRPLAALMGGVLFASSYFTHLLVDILPLEALASSWIPWAAWCLLRAQASLRWPAWSAAAALAYAGVPWLGGFIQFLPGLVVLGTLLLCSTLRQPTRARAGRALATLTLFMLIMSLVSAGKLLPLWHWIALTDRAGGIDPSFAMGGTLTPAEVLEWALNEGWMPWALLLCGLVLGLRRRDSWAMPYGVAVVVLLLIVSGPLYKLLYEYAPGFRYVREPRRVWLLMPAVLPVAAAIGVAHLQERLRLAGGRAVLAGAALLALVVADVVVWSRYELPARTSLSERLSANAIHQDLARRAREEPRFRVIDIAKARARVKQTADLMRSSLGLESMEGILGNVAIREYDIDYLNLVRASKAKLLGVMNGRYVISRDPLDEPGLRFVGGFEQDPKRPFRGIDGPYLYRNELALSRASLAEHALCVVGGDPAQQGELMLRNVWDPRKTVMVRCEPDVFAALPDDTLRLFDGVLFHDPGLDELQARVRELGVRSYAVPEAGAAGLLPWLVAVVAVPSPPLRALADPLPEWNAAHVSLPEDAGGRWLVLAETYAIYPGWTARIDGQPVPLLAANAVATAVPLPPGAREVSFAYMPPGLVAGMGITLAGLLLAALALRRPARPAAPAR